METPTKKNYFVRILFRIYIYLRNKFDPKQPPKEEEILCKNICSKVINSETSKLFYSPISYTRFVKNDQRDIYIKIENRMIQIVNHVYSYSVYIEDTEIYSNIIKKFDEELEKRRKSLDDEIQNNIKHSLRNILEKID
jgi:hypothetical protein